MSMNIDFSDVEPIAIPFTLGGKRYTLHEANGDAACRYRNAQLKCSRTGENGKIVVDGPIADTEPLLVSLCVTDEAGSSVPEDVVRGWPSRVVRKLYARVREISELNDAEQGESPKNEQTATTDGSV